MLVRALYLIVMLVSGLVAGATGLALGKALGHLWLGFAIVVVVAGGLFLAEDWIWERAARLLGRRRVEIFDEDEDNQKYQGRHRG